MAGRLACLFSGAGLRDNESMNNVNSHSAQEGRSDRTPRPAAAALTKTGGFLAGFTHTLQPYIGCTFGCEYCYVKALNVHRFHQPPLEWGDYAHPRTGIVEKLAGELTRYEQRGELDSLAIFMSSATDPYQGLERRWRLSRGCLDAFIERPPGILILQTRSPLVADDFERLAALGERCWLNFTLETDLDEVRAAITPRCPSVEQRLSTLAAARAAGLNVQITVSPCLPFSHVETFGKLLLAYGDRVIVDSYASGDGQGGRRTARTGIPDRYAALGWEAWDAEEDAQILYAWLTDRLADRVGWSQAGFAYLVEKTIQQP